MLKSLFKNLSVFFLFSSFCYSDQVYLTLIQEIYLNSIPKDIILHEGIAYVTTDGALYSFTTADPYNTEQTIYSNLNGTTSLAFSGRYGFTMNSGEVINIYDFTKKHPLQKGTIMISGSIKKLVIENGYLYTINDNIGLQVYDVNVVDFPVFRNTQMLPGGNVKGIFVKDKKAYVTSETASLSIIDVGDVSKLPIIGSYSTGVNFQEAYVDGNYAFVPQGTGGVQVLNITKLPFPEWVINIFARKYAKQVVSSNFYVWVADENTVEGFFNNRPGSYFYAGNYENGDASINRIAVIEGKYIYVCSNDKKLKILKIDYKY